MTALSEHTSPSALLSDRTINRRFFQSLADQSPMFIGMCDMNYVPFYINDAGRHLVGIQDLEHFRNTPVKEFFFPEDQDFILNDFFPRVFKYGRAQTEIRFRHFKTSEAIWMTYDVFFLEGEDGKPAGLATVSRNITDRKQAEDALRTSEERLAAILASATDAIVAFDGDGRVVLFNSTAETMFGWKAEEVLGGSIDRFIPAPLREEHRLHQKHLADSGVTHRVMSQSRTISGLKATGEEFPIEASISRCGQDDKLTFTIILRDITQRSHADAALQESIKQEKRRSSELKAIVDTAPVGIAIALDAEGKDIKGNRTIQELFGVGPDAQLSRRVAQPGEFRLLSEGRELPVDALPMQRALRGEIVEAQMMDVQRPDGSTRTVLGHASPLRDESHAVRGAVGAFLDVTSLKQAEQALQESNQRFRSMAELSPDALLVFQEGRYVFANAAVARLLGARDAEELLGLTPYDIVAPESHQTVRERIRAALQEDRVVPFIEYQWIRRDDGARVDVEVATGPILWDGKPAVQAAARDITARKQAARALEEADRRKSEFLAVLAHELRNPLAPIRNGLIVLQSGVDGSEAARARDMMKSQLDHLVRLVDDLMEISRISQGRIELQKRRLELGPLVDEVVVATHPLLAERDHALKVSIPPEPLILEADPTRVVQVLTNLVHNAVKFTPRGGRLQIWAGPENGDVVIGVRDNGIGIPREKLGAVFGLFAQIDGARAQGHGGLGIGLALVRSLVELHGGRVECRSEGEGKGAEFIIRLPLAEPEAADELAEMRSTEATAAPELRILVVDDTRTVADSLAMVLETLGANVHVAYDGRSALEAFSTFAPSLIIMDVGMPEMDGCETARRLRALPGGKSVRLVALTGWGRTEDRERSLAAGFDEHLVKPVEFEDLKACLSRAAGA